MVNIFYSTHDQPFENAYERQFHTRYLEPAWLDIAATECADEYHSNHDGWEDYWDAGIPFTLWRLLENGEPERLGRFVIERETVPQFYTTKVELS